MTIELFQRRREGALARRLIVWLCRLCAVAMFAMGLFCWVRLVGVFDGPLWRFDLMPLQWRMATPALAVLYPVAGVGLWMLTSWGVVVWVVVALAEAFMAFALPAGLAADRAIVLSHVGALSLLLVLRVLGWFLERRAKTV